MPSTTKLFPAAFYLSAIVFFLAYIIISVMGFHQYGGWPLMFFFLSLAIGFRSHPFLKGFSYTVTILAVVSLAMYYPQYFKTIGDVKLTTLIVPFMQVIMFGMGTELSLKDFAEVLRAPKGVLVGIICHYTIMPLVGFAVAKAFNFPAEVAAGIILIGCCPSGLASNVMCYLAKANLALSVSVTTISTLVAPLFTPLLMKLLGGSYIEIKFWDMAWDITKIVILPVIAGLAFHYLVRGKFKWLDKAMPYFSMIGIGLVLVVITAGGRDKLLQVGALLLAATLIHNLLGYFLGYWSARLLKFPEKDCRTIALEVGMQNAGLATGLAQGLGKAAAGAALAPAIFGTMMNVTGSSLASWWHHRNPEEKEEIETTASPHAESAPLEAR